jgi:signal transduction histidine kinase
VRLGGRERWRLVVVSWLAGMARERRDVTLRGAAVTGGVLALVLVLGVFMLRQERREAALEERLRLQDDLIRAEKLATVGVLSAGIAHEVGTPLAIVRATAERELRRAAEPGRRAALASIVEEIDRVSRILRGLLDFSRRKSAAHREPVALGPIAHATVELVAPVSQRSGVDIAVDIEADLPELLADGDHLQQVLLNLLINACDACATRGPSGHVSLSARAVEDQVEIRIRDTGPGIPAEHLHRVFDPFFTTKKRGEGTGLGLSVVADLVKAHEARIDIDTQVGAGTVVRLAWPTAARADGAPR